MIAVQIVAIGAVFAWVIMSAFGRYYVSIGSEQAVSGRDALLKTGDGSAYVTAAQLFWTRTMLFPVWVIGAGAFAWMQSFRGNINDWPHLSRRKRMLLGGLVIGWVMLHFYGTDLVAMLLD
jgi:hypothetical protein